MASHRRHKEPVHRSPPAGSRRAERRRGGGDVAVQRDRAAVVERVRHDHRRVDLLHVQLELADRGRGDRHRREARAVVVHEVAA